VYEPRGYTARGDATRSGVVSLAPLEAPREVAWTADVGASLPAATVRSAGDAVIERSAGGVLALRDAADGAVRWLRRDVALGGTAVRAGEVVVVAEPGRLRGFDVADGVERWTAPTLDDTAELHPDGDTVLALSRRADRLWALDAATGAVRWELDASARLGVSIQRVVAGGAGTGLWVTSPPGLPPDSSRVEHRAVLLDAATGGVRFERPLAPLGAEWASGGDPLAVGERSVAVVTTSTAPDDLGGWGVELLDADGGTLRRLDEVGFPDRMAASGETLVVASRAQGLLAVDLRTGGRRWVRPDIGGLSGLTAADGLVVAGVGTLLDAASGRTLATLRRLDLRAVAGERTVQVLPAVSGTELELRDRRGEPVGTRSLVLDESPAPAVGASRVFVPTRDGVRTHLVADGRRDWTYAQLETTVSPGGGRPTAHTPAVAASTVLVSPGSPFGRGPGLVALELTGGVRTWDRDEDRPAVRGPLTLAGEVAFVPVGTEVHAYDVLTGRRAFAAIARAALGPLVLTPNRVIGGPSGTAGEDAGTEAVAILRRDRSESWRTPLVPCSGPALAGDRVVWGTAVGVTALDELSGEPAWELALPRPVCLDPVVAGGRVVVVEDPGTLRAVAAADGEPAWSTALPSPAVAAPVVAGDVLLVALLDGTLRGYGLEDGAERWSSELGGIADASPAVLDGRVLVHLRDGRLLALRS
jgi:outer membrane protein assembly factor BamB